MSSRRRISKRTKEPNYLRESCSVASFSTRDSSDHVWLPPIASLLLPLAPSPSHADTRQNRYKEVYMPWIPYFFHHQRFGIEACMMQLMEARCSRYRR